MKLIHKPTGQDVTVGLVIKHDGVNYTIVSWEEPTSPASSGLVTAVRGKMSAIKAVQRANSSGKAERYYAGVYDCEFVDRTDRDEIDEDDEEATDDDDEFDEEGVVDLLEDLLENEDGIRRVESFEDVGMLTYNKGVVVQMRNGAEFQITVVRSKNAKR